MAGALVEIWLTVSALSSLVIIMIALGHSDMRRERRLRPRPLRRRPPVTRSRRARIQAAPALVGGVQNK